MGTSPKIVYMGTPDFSLEPLKVLMEQMSVVLVVSKPDAIVGRKKVLTSSPVKKLAMENDIPVFTPESIKKDYQSIIDAQPDLIVTCAYGKIIPKELIDYPKYGCVNIHASLLPKYRGSAPIQWALINGESETGITLMYMDEFMDTLDFANCLFTCLPEVCGTKVSSKQIYFTKPKSSTFTSSRSHLLNNLLINITTLSYRFFYFSTYHF